MPNETKQVRNDLPVELAIRYKKVVEAAGKTDVGKAPLDEYVVSGIKRALDMYELKYLDGQPGYTLSDELQLAKTNRANGVKKAKNKKEDNRLKISLAKCDPASVHHLFEFDIVTDNSAEVDQFNLKLKKLAGVLKVMSDHPAKPRKLKAGVNDLVLSNGWGGLEPVVQKVFGEAHVKRTADYARVEPPPIPENSVA